MSARVCQVCSKASAQYKCPRCGVQYCSSACYSTHGASCTEAFYKECVEGELRSQPPVDAAEMRKILLREGRAAREQSSLPDGDDDDGDEEEDDDEIDEDTKALRAVLQTLELDPEADPEKLLEMLPDSQREKFRQVLADSELDGVGVWRPWWMPAPEIGIGDGDGDGDKDSDTEPAKRPRVPDGLPAASALSAPGKPISPLVRNSLAEMLVAYAITMRSFDGDCEENAVDAALTALDICRPLHDDRGAPPPTVMEAVRRSVELATRDGSPVDAPREFSIGGVRDAVRILQLGGDAAAAAVGQLHSVLAAAARDRSLPPERRAALSLSARKAWFHAAFANGLDRMAADLLAAEVEQSWAALRAETHRSAAPLETAAAPGSAPPKIELL